MVGISGGRRLQVSNDVQRREYGKSICTLSQVNAYTAALVSIEVAGGIAAWAVDMGNCRREHMAGLSTRVKPL